MDETARRPLLDTLLQRMREQLSARSYSAYTVRAYLAWVARFARYHPSRHPADLSSAAAREFLTFLAVRGRVAPSTQNQARSALVFFLETVLQRRLAGPFELPRAREGHRVPVVLSAEEVRAVLGRMTGAARLVAALLYGSGLRLSEGCRLRVADLDFARQTITVRDGKGGKDRTTLLPARLVPSIKRQLESAGALHRVDLEAGAGWAPLPPHLHASQGHSSRDWQWQWVFPAERCRTADPGATPLRPHIHPSVVQRDFAIALRAAAVPKHATCRTLRHSFATHLYEAGHNIRVIDWRPAGHALGRAPSVACESMVRFSARDDGDHYLERVLGERRRDEPIPRGPIRGLPSCRRLLRDTASDHGPWSVGGPPRRHILVAPCEEMVWTGSVDRRASGDAIRVPGVLGSLRLEVVVTCRDDGPVKGCRRRTRG